MMMEFSEAFQDQGSQAKCPYRSRGYSGVLLDLTVKVPSSIRVGAQDMPCESGVA